MCIFEHVIFSCISKMSVNIKNDKEPHAMYNGVLNKTLNEHKSKWQ